MPNTVALGERGPGVFSLGESQVITIAGAVLPVENLSVVALGEPLEDNWAIGKGLDRESTEASVPGQEGELRCLALPLSGQCASKGKLAADTQGTSLNDVDTCACAAIGEGATSKPRHSLGHSAQGHKIRCLLPLDGMPMTGDQGKSTELDESILSRESTTDTFLRSRDGDTFLRTRDAFHAQNELKSLTAQLSDIRFASLRNSEDERLKDVIHSLSSRTTTADCLNNEDLHSVVVSNDLGPHVALFNWDLRNGKPTIELHAQSKPACEVAKPLLDSTYAATITGSRETLQNLALLSVLTTRCGSASFFATELESFLHLLYDTSGLSLCLGKWERSFEEEEEEEEAGIWKGLDRASKSLEGMNPSTQPDAENETVGEDWSGDRETEGNRLLVKSRKHLAKAAWSEAQKYAEEALVIFLSLGLEDEQAAASICMQQALQRAAGKGSTLIDLLGASSWAARCVFFLGGQKQLRSRALQHVYDFIFLASFVVGAAFCFGNFVVQWTPPDHVWSNAITIYLNFVACHAWLFWRGFLDQAQVERFIRSFFLTTDDPTSKSIRRSTQCFFILTLCLQVVLTIVGVLAFAQPACDYCTTRCAAGSECSFALAHNVVLWISIPIQVSTMLAAINLAFVTCVLHGIDMERVIDFIANPQAPTLDMLEGTKKKSNWNARKSAVLETCYSLVECAQDRLTYSCERWFVMWIHLFLFSCLQCTVSLYHISEEAADELEWDRARVFQLLADMFHLSLGSLGVLVAVLLPMTVTPKFTQAPGEIMRRLRRRGYPVQDIAEMMSFLRSRLPGFTMMGESISAPVLVKGSAVLLIGIPLYLQWGSV
mmetsp:Transcript_93107/g.146314  ORF Transcript_93107/g.146314 Transcript_93107/m.146314 type:complete len:830 (+) Transcript_93107:34-2523(+)